ncbi:hypothetical protein C8R45DRAFT_1213102 [Mycena sanguinolenta]|nr:hypothetical protein C8R45DRAFT_1213102 [Mycena sanguinolenta]
MPFTQRSRQTRIHQIFKHDLDVIDAFVGICDFACAVDIIDAVQRHAHIHPPRRAAAIRIVAAADLTSPNPTRPALRSQPSPATTSKLLRFLQPPANRDHSKSLPVDRPPSAACSSATYASHSIIASHATSNSSSALGRRSAKRFLGFGSARTRIASGRGPARRSALHRAAGKLLAASPTAYNGAGSSVLASSSPSSNTSSTKKTLSLSSGVGGKKGRTTDAGLGFGCMRDEPKLIGEGVGRVDGGSGLIPRDVVIEDDSIIHFLRSSTNQRLHKQLLYVESFAS